ncbi:helix-turn-helix transcriptional regulator [Micromonospora sp. NPDC048986]|uniref:helix-turn-helix domain-containing protein n=1 Tax=Micromonospora sp. NPDC048986 TaxID=3155644 RepID=UPI0033E124F2
MANALARSRRLAAALIALRTDRGMSHRMLASAAGVSTALISRMEHPEAHLTSKPELARKPSPDAIPRLLGALGVAEGSDLWSEIVGLAIAGSVPGWWETMPLGARQRAWAKVEDGTSWIAEYGIHLWPGLVQHPDYAQQRARVGQPHPTTVDVHVIVAGRVRRQQVITEGVTYNLVVEEQAIRRPSVPDAVMAAQLDYVLKLTELPKVSIQVLPVSARVADGPVSNTPYSLMTYPDPEDPRIVAIDTTSDDFLVTDESSVEGYAQLHTRLRAAALSDEDSAAFIREAAAELAAS